MAGGSGGKPAICAGLPAVSARRRGAGLWFTRPVRKCRAATETGCIYPRSFVQSWCSARRESASTATLRKW